MPPATVRAFGFETVPEEAQEEEGGDGEGKEPLPDEMARVRRPPQEDGSASAEEEEKKKKYTTANGMTENGKDRRIYRGLGADMGPVTLPPSSSTSSSTGLSDPQTIPAGRLLMRDTWNASLYAPLHASYTSSLSSRTPDVWIHKNRMSGLWGAGTPCTEYLEERGLRTLLFAGVNTDQCVAGSLQDAFAKGWDCVLVREACGTSSPGFARECVEHNCARSWGFVVGVGELGRGVEEMVGK